jgi:hypothetical protein
MPALGNNRVLVRLAADNAGKWDTLQQLLVIIVIRALGGLARAFALRHHPPVQLLALGLDVPFTV